MNGRIIPDLSCGGTIVESMATTVAGRSGKEAASAREISPPKLCPTTTGFSIPSRSHIHKVVGKPLNSVVLQQRVAPAMSAQVYRHDTVATAKVLELGREVRVVASYAMHQKNGRFPASRLFVKKGNTVAVQPPHKCLPP